MLVWSRNGANKTKAFVKGHSWHQKKRMWEEQLVYPPIAYITSVNVMLSSVKWIVLIKTTNCSLLVLEDGVCIRSLDFDIKVDC